MIEPAADLLEHLSEALIVIDADERISLVNGRARELFGHASDQLLGASAWTVIPSDQNQPLRQACERALRERVAGAVEEYLGPRGRWLRVRVHPASQGVALLLSDVTEARMLRQALRESEERARLIELATNDLVYDWDVPADRIRWSGVLHSGLGYPRELASSDLQWWSLRLHPDDRAEVMAGLQRALQGDDTVWTAEYRFQRADGSYLHALERGHIGRDAAGAAVRMIGSITDVTQRRRAEAELLAAKNQLEIFLDTVPDQAWLKDREGRYRVVNDAYVRARGLPRDEILGKTDFDLFPPEVAERFRSRDERVMRAGRRIRFEESLRQADGSRRWYEEAKAPLRLAGEVVGTVGISRDITRRKRMERALRESEERFREIANNVHEVFWLMDVGEDPDRDFRMVYVSPEVERIFGQSAQSVLDDPASAIASVSAEHRARIATALRGAIAGEEGVAEYRVSHPERGPRWVRTRYFPVRDGRGRVYRVAGLSEDVTDRIEAEVHYRRLVETAPFGIYTVDLQGRVTEANSALGEILGVARESLLGHRFVDFVDPEDLDMALRRFAERSSGFTGTRDFEIRARRADGERRLLHVRSTAILLEEEHTGTLGAVRDVTEERARDQYLRRAERLASVATLIGGVAHELNNPLAAIKSFAQLLLLDERPSDDREALEAVGREADRAAGIVTRLRQLARDPQTRAQARREPLDLNDVVRSALRACRYSLEDAAVEVVVELAADLEPVLGDRGDLEQVVLNLLANAEQALAQREPPRRLVVRTAAGESGAALHLMDNGPGMTPEVVSRIFDPFFTTRPPGQGVGLGLSLVHSIVAEHGGEIHVQSEPGGGAAFRVDLPLAPRVSAEPPARSDPPGRRLAARELRVLVVDDEEAIRYSVSRFLARRGHVVTVAEDGEAALARIAAAAAARSPFDVILSDLRMPGLGGEALLRRLREQGEGMDRRLVFMSGDAAHAPQDAGAPPIVYKPFELERVAQLLEQKAAGP